MLPHISVSAAVRQQNTFFRRVRILLWMLTSIQLVVMMNGAASPLQHHRILFIITSKLCNCCIMDLITGWEAAC